MKFWRCIKSQRKNQIGVLKLCVNDKLLTKNEKTEVLDKQFHSVFTGEDLTNIPECPGHLYPVIPSILFSTKGIQNLLYNFDISNLSTFCF